MSEFASRHRASDVHDMARRAGRCELTLADARPVFLAVEAARSCCTDRNALRIACPPSAALRSLAVPAVLEPFCFKLAHALVAENSRIVGVAGCSIVLVPSAN